MVIQNQVPIRFAVGIRKRINKTCCYLDIFGNLWCKIVTRPDRYETPHCSVNLEKLSCRFYRDYTRFEPSKLQLSSYVETLS